MWTFRNIKSISVSSSSKSKRFWVNLPAQSTAKFLLRKFVVWYSRKFYIGLDTILFTTKSKDSCLSVVNFPCLNVVNNLPWHRVRWSKTAAVGLVGTPFTWSENAHRYYERVCDCGLESCQYRVGPMLHDKLQKTSVRINGGGAYDGNVLYPAVWFN